MKLDKFVNQLQEKDKKGEDVKTPKEMEEKESVLVAMAQFISSLDDDHLDDDSYKKIDDAFEALFDVIVSLDGEDFDDKSDKAFVKLMDAFDSLETVDTDDVDEAYKYKARKARGKVRSGKSKLTGSDKLKYIKKLKKNKKKYKRSASLRMKAKKTGKKYRKSGKGKATKRIYKSLNK